MKLRSSWCLALLLTSLACSATHDPARGGAGYVGGGRAGASGTGAGGTGSGAGSGAGGAAGASGGVATDDAGVSSPTLIDDCGANNASALADADLQKLLAGSGKADGLRVLYPYDGTVFPRGLGAPLLMWDGDDTAEALYVHLKSGSFEYKGCLKPSAPGQLQLTDAVWMAAQAQAHGAADPFTLELRSIKAGVAKGPLVEKLVIAQATLKGSIYYNSYASKLAANAGAVLRVSPGQSAQLFIGGSAGCKACHAVSAGGTRLVAQNGNQTTGDVYALDPITSVAPAPLISNAPFANFVGLSPDGKVYLTSSSTNGAGLRSSGSTTPAAGLYETDTGVAIANTAIPTTAMMPTFSSDGKLLVFTDNAIASGSGLALMDYDATARTAKNYRMVYKDAAKLTGWPFVMPDNHSVVFALGTEKDFSGGNVGINPIAGFGGFLGGLSSWVSGTRGPYSELFIVAADGGGAATPVLLGQAMGYATPADAASRTSYLPFGMEDLEQNYYPTVSPVAAGGYFWVFFDSMRHYGNKGSQRQLWGTAVTVSADGTYKSDPSHPAFYLTGQEEGTGNHRAFTALDPCRGEGQSCTTGIDCCGGFCTDGLCNKPSVPRCAKTDEACSASSDCCNKADSCIAGFCGEVIPQ